MLRIPSTCASDVSYASSSSSSSSSKDQAEEDESLVDLLTLSPAAQQKASLNVGKSSTKQAQGRQFAAKAPAAAVKATHAAKPPAAASSSALESSAAATVKDATADTSQGKPSGERCRHASPHVGD
jgi:hypothetical protein